MKMKLPPLQPRSRMAHEAAHWARTQGRFADFNAAVFRAFFERGEDIGDVGVLASLATDLGLAADSLRTALENQEFEKGVLQDEQEAAQIGVSAVPAFVADRKAAVSGVQSVESLRELIEHVKKGENERLRQCEISTPEPLATETGTQKSTLRMGVSPKTLSRLERLRQIRANPLVSALLLCLC